MRASASGLRPGAASPRSFGFLQEGVQFALPFLPMDATVFRRGSFGRGKHRAKREEAVPPRALRGPTVTHLVGLRDPLRLWGWGSLARRPDL